MRTWLLVLAAGCGFRPGTALERSDARVDGSGVTPDAAPTTATLFAADFMAQKVFRYSLAAGSAAPPAPLTVTVNGALSPLFVPATGELLVGELATSTIQRLATPFAIPTPTSTITNNGLSNEIDRMTLVDGEAWAVNSGAADVVRLAFDSQGNASMVGSIPATNGRGIVFDRATRDLYVTECCATNTILHFKVAADRTATAQPSLSGAAAGLLNPHGLAIAPWGELFVADAGTSQVFRFLRDGSGNLSANGKLTGNGLATPISAEFTPWGELFVTNQTTGTISRFAFDSAHLASDNGLVTVPGAQKLSWATLAF
jgi:DNA-binding beta-propeller fold protein YncE